MARYTGTDQEIQDAYDYYTKRVGRKSSKMTLQQFAQFHYGRQKGGATGDEYLNAADRAGIGKEYRRLSK